MLAVQSAVTTYAEAVVNGDVLTGKFVKQACERHLRDLERDDIYFDDDLAQEAIDFFPKLQHHKGEWAGRPVYLEPWQKFIIGSLFGWVLPDGNRRFRTAYNEMGRKNGKSTLAAGLGLYLAFFDGEPGAEVYAAATKRDQSKIVWNEAKLTVQKTPNLRRYVTPLASNLHSERTNSKFEPLGADKDGMDGLNIHGAIVDELHAHKTRAMWDVLETATGARRQPMIFVITTAGFDKNSICWQQHDYGTKVLDQIIDDDSFFAYIATIDEDDDWQDETIWAKANPNLHVSVKLDKLQTDCQKAQQMPSQQNAFRRLHMCQWTEQADRWMDMEAWGECGEAFNPTDLLGQSCYGALDLSSTTDLSSLCLVFDGGEVLNYNWIPSDNMRKRIERDRVPYDVWVTQGHIEATEGNVIDYDVIHARIRELGELFHIREIAIDRWNSTQLQTQLQGDGFTMVPFGQGFASMSAPTKELQKKVLAKELKHGNQPVLRWAASNVAVLQDAAGNIKPAKDKSMERIDPIVALIMAIARQTVNDNGDSYYSDHDLLVL